MAGNTKIIEVDGVKFECTIILSTNQDETINDDDIKFIQMDNEELKLYDNEIH